MTLVLAKRNEGVCRQTSHPAVRIVFSRRGRLSEHIQGRPDEQPRDDGQRHVVVKAVDVDAFGQRRGRCADELDLPEG